MNLLDLMKDFLVAEGFTADEIFKHHANDPEADYILLTTTSINTRSDDELKDYFNDIVRVTVNRVDSTFETVLSLKDSITDALVKLHATAEIIKSSKVGETEPLRISGKIIQWVGLFRITGQFT